jgi:tagatose 1,6-diphosphate aldolase
MLQAFLPIPDLADDHLRLRLRTTEGPEESFWKAPTYRFSICLTESALPIGHINLRVGESILMTHYTGHIGYAIDEPHRGHHYAERACRLLLPFAFAHEMPEVWITCAPDNLASRRTLERLGAEYVETVRVPDEYPLDVDALRQKRRYRVSRDFAHRG